MLENLKKPVTLGILCLFLPIFCVLFLIFVPSLLVPAAYFLAVDGYVISRTLCILFIANWMLKIGLILLGKKQ